MSTYDLPDIGEPNWGDKIIGTLDYLKDVAETTRDGAVHLASDAASAAGTDTTASVSPAGLKYALANGAVAAGLKAAYVAPAAKSTSGTAAPLPFVNVKDFGALLDGTTDDLAAIQAAVNAVGAGGRVTFPPGSSTRISNALNITVADVTLDGNGATITQTGSSKVTIAVTAAGANIRNLTLVGKATDYSSGTSSAVAIAATSTSKLRIDGCRITGHAGAGIRLLNTTEASVDGCTIVGTSPPSGDGTEYGIIVDGTSSKVWITGNDISATCQGIISGYVATDLTITGNQIHDITGQHGMYLQNGTRLVITGNSVKTCQFNGIKVQLSEFNSSDSYGTTITGNAVTGCGANGILLTNSDVAFAYLFRDVTVTGNTVRDAVNQGIYLDSVSGFTCGLNVVTGAQFSGLATRNARNGVVSNNVLQESRQNGIHLIAASGATTSRVLFRGNLIVNPATGDVTSSDMGIMIDAGDNLVFENNIIRDANARMRYGIFNSGGDQATMTIKNNYVTGATDYGIRLIATTAIREWRNNDVTGTLGTVLNLPTTGAGRVGKEEFKSAAPTSGAYVVGDMVWNTAPAASGSMGWVCTTAGSPGTWKTFGAISA